MRSLLPSGGNLPAEDFEVRHLLLVVALWCLAVVLPLLGLLSGRTPGAHVLLHLAPLLVPAVLASWRALPRRVRASSLALGLLAAAATGVHLAGGRTEAHFAFFVVVIVLTIYEDWWLFGLCIAFTLLHHGILGMIAPEDVFADAEQAAQPWTWAAVHAVAIGLAGLGGLLTWRLNESVRSRLQALVEQVPGVTYVIDLGERPGQEHLRYLSAQSAGLLDVAPVTGPAPLALVLDRFGPQDQAAFRDRLHELRGGRVPPPLELRIVRADGTEVWLRDQSAPVRMPNGHLRAQGLLLDVTAHKLEELENRRIEHELRLAQKLESVGQLAAGVAHEINTPVQYVSDTVTFLRSAFEDVLELVEAVDGAVADAEDPDVARRTITEAAEVADLPYLRERVPAAIVRAEDGLGRVTAIVGALREFTRADQSELAPADLNALVRTTLTVARHEVRYVSDVALELGQLPLVTCNRGELGQVLLNLVVNAAHAIADTGDRGTITLRTSCRGGEVLVEVADTGGGIPQEVADRVFDPFFTTKEVGRGTGQGLAIARTLVERHQGRMDFATSPAGTTFRVVLPVDGVGQAAIHQDALAA